jgi:hypothetical protein
MFFIRLLLSTDSRMDLRRPPEEEGGADGTARPQPSAARMKRKKERQKKMSASLQVHPSPEARRK